MSNEFFEFIDKRFIINHFTYLPTGTQKFALLNEISAARIGSNLVCIGASMVSVLVNMLD